MIRALRHFGIVVRDLKPMLAFYQGLGLKIEKEAVETGEFIDTILGSAGTKVTTVKLSAPEGEALIELLCFEKPPVEVGAPSSLFRPGPTHFALTVGNVRALFHSLSEKGIRFISPPRLSPDGNAMVAFCFDPEGNPIELVEML